MISPTLAKHSVRAGMLSLFRENLTKHSLSCNFLTSKTLYLQSSQARSAFTTTKDNLQRNSQNMNYMN